MSGYVDRESRGLQLHRQLVFIELERLVNGSLIAASQLEYEQTNQIERPKSHCTADAKRGALSILFSVKGILILLYQTKD